MDDMKSRKRPISLIVIGSLLVLGPLWGVMGTVVGMIRAFGDLAQSVPASPEQLASDISASLWSTVAGFVMVPIGLALLIGGILWLVKINKQLNASNQAIIGSEAAPQFGR
jgi:flagellar motor component MotA